MNNNLEILAPAGSPEALEAAVRAGTDAVYLGGSLFSARANARNFDNDALKQAIEYCHARGVRVHLALNTLMLDSELPAALALAEYACTLPVDAILVQDLGLLRLLRKCAPGMPLHASTQLSAHTPAAVQALEEAGFERIVLSREMSLKEIKEVRDATTKELESFVHGALCMSVSGQCYFSSVLGSRSGNRGLCAQPCRLPFSAPGGTGHDLSLKDLSMITRVDELRRAGVMSAKIEGRMKRPEYVAAAVHACRLAADGEEIPADLLENLGAVFSRSGFTTGFQDGKLGRDMFGTRSKEDVTAATDTVFAQLHQLYQRENPRVPITLHFTVQAGEQVHLCAQDEDGHKAQAFYPPAEPAKNRPLTEERCKEQLVKTGNTPFYVKEITCTIQEGLSLPVSALNQLRRGILEDLEEQRKHAPAIPFTSHVSRTTLHTGTAGEALPLRLRFAAAEQIPPQAKQCELIYVPMSIKPETCTQLLESGIKLAVEIPRGLFGMEQAARKKLELLKSAGVTDVWAGNIGAAQLAKPFGFTVHGGFSLNIFNTEALKWYTEFGLADTELSFELTLPQASHIGGTLKRGLLLYGRLPLMLTRNCPAANGPQGCLNCKEAPLLTDRKGIQFPVQCSGACSEVLNSVPLYMADRMQEVHGMDFGVLRFTTESREEAAQILSAYRMNQKAKEGAYTRGLYYKGVI